MSTQVSEAPLAAEIRQWCGEFCTQWTEGFSTAYWELCQVWKRVCFAQLRVGYGVVRDWDNIIRANIQRIWQPLSDFQYVAQIYPYLSNAENHTLYPELTARYLSWMTTEQMEVHRQLYSNMAGESRPLVEGEADDTSGSDGSTRGEFSMAGTAYPLTNRQLFKAARVCNDAEWAVKSLLEWLDEFRRCRRGFVLAGDQRRYNLRPKYTQAGNQAIKCCLELIEYLVAKLKGSPVLLCEAMGMDPAKVPSCCYPLRDGQEAQMSGASVTQVPVTHIPRQQDRTTKLERSFEFQRASLYMGHIALKMNTHTSFLSHEVAIGISRRMLARSEKLVNQAIKAGESRREAKMRRLSQKIRDVSQITDQDGPPETISLLCSVTRPALLEPQSGDGVRTYDNYAKLPLETLLDKLDLLFMQVEGPPSSSTKGAVSTTPSGPEKESQA